MGKGVASDLSKHHVLCPKNIYDLLLTVIGNRLNGLLERQARNVPILALNSHCESLCFMVKVAVDNEVLV